MPIGDIARRRPLLTALLAVETLALAASAIAPDLALLGALAVIIGVTSVVVQMLVPYAATLAPDEQRSRVIGTLMSGLLNGILLSRTFAGVIAQVAGWRVVYGVAAVAMALTTIALRVSLPDHPRELSVGYREQMRGVLTRRPPSRSSAFSRGWPPGTRRYLPGGSTPRSPRGASRPRGATSPAHRPLARAGGRDSLGR